MSTRFSLQISLARKCQLLFGLAVLLIIAAALFVPSYFMDLLVQELQVRETRKLASLARARLDVSDKDWSRQQETLEQWWSLNASTLDLPKDSVPSLIRVPTPTAIEEAERQRRQLQKTLDQLSTLTETWSEVASPRLNPPLSWQLINRTWYAVPASARHALSKRADSFADRLSGYLIEKYAPFPPLDDFQARILEEMRQQPHLIGRGKKLSELGQGLAYRYVMGVRDLPTGAEQPPLIGLIDVRLSDPRAREMLILARVILVLAGMLAGFLAILVFYLISQRLILAPVRELTALVERIGGGDLKARANLATGDEFEDLSDAFNDMLARLERARADLESANRSLDAKLGELAETNVALFESNRVKSEFLANVSHELRTPLTSIIGFADLLRDGLQSGGEVDAGRYARYADNILTSGRGLLELINDLLDLAKIEARRVELHRAPFSLQDVCDALADFVRPSVDKKNLNFNVQLASDLPVMNSDAGKLRQILFNLLSNAIKYTPEGGTVAFRVSRLDAEESVKIDIEDTGPGIALEDQATIFEKFKQLDSSVTREHSGTGLGLAISHELCSLLGGTIRVESELGRGARFIVELPIECPEKTDRNTLPKLSL